MMPSHGGAPQHRKGSTERITLHVPDALNDGSPVSSEQLATLEDALLDIAGGFTLTLGVGGWRSPDGRKYCEPIRLYSIDVDDVETAFPRARELAEHVRAALAQQAVYVAVITAEDISPQHRVAHTTQLQEV